MFRKREKARVVDLKVLRNGGGKSNSRRVLRNRGRLELYIAMEEVEEEPAAGEIHDLSDVCMVQHPSDEW